MQKVFDTVEEFWSIKDFNKIKNHASENSLPYFKRELSNYLEVDQKCLHFTPSAHKGLELLLSSVESYDRKVLAPAFNCPVVEDAIKNSGWGVELYDFSTKIGFFDWDDLIDRLDKDIGIVVITHYFGVPQNFLKIKDRCKDLGILIIEDCAHTLGGKINGMMAGTIGDASVFSFNYDKPISLGWGGLVIVNNQNKFKNLKTNRWLIPSIKEELFLLNNFMLSMSRRRIMITLNHLTIIKILGKLKLFEYFFKQGLDKDANISIGSIQAELGSHCIRVYRDALNLRNKNSTIVENKINTLSWPVDEHVDPAWLKQKIFVNNIKAVSNISFKMQRDGYRVGNFNWPNLLKHSDINKFKNSESASKFWIDVPIHQNIDETLMSKMIAKINNKL